jgi:GMP synthase-like glutamine amidotransferase
MKVLAVTHGPDVRPELLGDVVQAHGHELVEWDITAAGAPTVVADAVMVFGGAQNVGEELTHPWLHEEYDALRRWLDDGTPLLGVCLGAQTLAHAAGAPVSPVGATLAGFVPTRLTAAGMADPVLGALPATFGALNANRYGFEVPEDGVELARADGLSQAFRVGARAWGVQFHAEARGRRRRRDRAVAQARAAPRRGVSSGLERQVVVTRPLVPRPDVVARVVAERAQDLRGHRRA